ncbi:hypothetical protein P153DRAFT_364295 [Dothidotthia symphoricarpi CBS 119687]|uniref:ABM domain-containing protein n=1 Tax=Dothidotthia symphoricarpi CBS 119687 TaxID=1392245 RepID=A0A6A6AQ47_9PLEO|nr:uncharacterized protein P153DRAFT_364295 [Dothidotthia symphoricarpi CBS 119687]KAF2133074.1 hypothetical protein P153DRAFT_364295 [Dothidotthia symphoricarpi CBS 119687]
MTIDVIALLTPNPGKADRVEELLTSAAASVKANEPGTLKYHLQRETKGEAPRFFVLETYEDKAALATHAKTEYFAALGKAIREEELLVKPMEVFVTRGVGGFESKL